MGCASSSGHQDRDKRNSYSGSTGSENTIRSFFPPNGDLPTDNRPQLRQQPRRKSLDSPSPVIPVREELEKKKQLLELSSSQVAFFRMLEEKVEGPNLEEHHSSNSKNADSLVGGGSEFDGDMSQVSLQLGGDSHSLRDERERHSQSDTISGSNATTQGAVLYAQ